MLKRSNKLGISLRYCAFALSPSPLGRGDHVGRRAVFSFDLLVNAVVAGILLGGFYAAVSLGISVTFGLLDVVNIAHPAFIIVGAYAAYTINTSFELDPILAGLLFTPIFYALGVAVYRIYYTSFEKTGEQSLRG